MKGNTLKKAYKNPDGSINHQKLNKLRDKAFKDLINLHDKVNVKEVSWDYRDPEYKKVWNFILELTSEKEIVETENKN